MKPLLGETLSWTELEGKKIADFIPHYPPSMPPYTHLKETNCRERHL